MTIAHVASTTATASSGTVITLNKPAGTVAGHLMCAVFYVQSAFTPSITPPSGWTSRGGANGSGTRAEVFTKEAGSSEPADYAFTSSQTIVVSSGSISSYSSAGAIIIGDYLFDITAQNPSVAPSVTTVQPSAMLFCAYPTTSLGSGVTGMTSRVALDNGSRDIAAFDQVIASPGATGTRTFTGSNIGFGFSLSIEEQVQQNRIRMMI